MTPDHELLARYAKKGDEAAFAELVRRHVGHVYSTALRLLANDSHLAEDTVQSVFADLARKANSVRHTLVLSGWLHTSARFAAAKLVRSEQRRRQREQAACKEMNMTSTAPPDWQQMRPVLDDAIGELPDSDRDALLLRFFEQKSFAEIGSTLGQSENTARMRVNRALEKLRGRLLVCGITSSSAALGTALAENAAGTAPAGLAARVVSKSIAVATVAHSGGAHLLGTTTLAGKTALAGTALVAAAALVFLINSRPSAPSADSARDVQPFGAASEVPATPATGGPSSRVVGEADVTPAGPDAVPVVVRPLQESLRQNPQATAAAPDASEEFIAIVYTPDGDTAREAQVALPGPGFSFRLVPGRLVAGSEQNSSSIVQVDAEGRFKVRGRDKQRVIIADASGYTETTVQELRKNRTVRLGRWATLEGVWQTNGQPIVAAELSLQWFHRAPIGFLLDRAGFRAVTDAQGQFAFPKVPAGSLQVLAYSADHRGPVFPFPKIAEVELLPGDTQRLLITNPPPAPTQPLVLGDSIPAGKFWLNGADAASQGLMIYRDLSGVPVEADPEVLRHHTKVYFTNSQDMSRLELLAALERIFRDQAGLVLLRTGDNRLWVRYDKSAKSLERSN